MNLEKLKNILSQPIQDEFKEELILMELSKDPNASVYIIKMLDSERKRNKDCITDLNAEVSRYHVHSKLPNLMEENRSFLNNETKKLYEKWDGIISPCFNNKFE